MGFLSSVFDEIALKSVFLEEKKEKKYNLTPENVIGFKLFKEQWRWLFFLKNSYNLVDKVMGSRKYGKSEVITIYWVILLAVKYKKKVGIITKQFNRSKKLLRQIEDGLLKAGVELDISNSSYIYFKGDNTKEPNISAFTINQVIKGTHVDCIVCDDIVDEQDETSATELEHTINFYKNLVNITKKIIIVGQPVTETDLYAMLDGAEGVNCFNSFFGSIPELDINLDELRNLGIPERNIQRNYFGVLIADKDLPFADCTVANFDIKNNGVAVIDPAFGGGDKIGLTIGYNDYDSGKHYIKLFEFNGDVYNFKQEIIRTLENYKVYKCYIESNDGGGVLRDFKRTENTNIYFKGFRENKNKEVRILSRIGRFKNRIVLDGAVKNVINYNAKIKNNNDDVVDSLASYINLVDGNLEGVKEL